MTTIDPKESNKDDPVEKLVALGLAKPPMRTPRFRKGQEAVPLSRSLDELLDDDRSDVSL